MANMKFGAHTIAWNPNSGFDIVRKRKPCASVDTYTGVAYFGWTPLLAGKEINLEWDYLDATEFDILDALYVTDDQIVWDLLGDGTECYNVIIKNLDATYFLKYDDSYIRKDVKMTLLIMSEYTA